jgi:hypothetical protein
VGGSCEMRVFGTNGKDSDQKSMFRKSLSRGINASSEGGKGWYNTITGPIRQGESCPWPLSWEICGNIGSAMDARSHPEVFIKPFWIACFIRSAVFFRLSFFRRFAR